MNITPEQVDKVIKAALAAKEIIDGLPIFHNAGYAAQLNDEALTIVRGLAEDAEPVSLLKKPSSVDVSDKKAVVDMSRLPLMHQHDAYRMSKALTDHLAVVPVGKDAAPAAWRRPANEGETPTHVVTQIPRVADIWADQGCRVEPLYTSPQAAQTEAQEREAFEAWWDSGYTGCSNSGPWTHNTPIQWAWDAWLAGRKG